MGMSFFRRQAQRRGAIVLAAALSLASCMLPTPVIEDEDQTFQIDPNAAIDISFATDEAEGYWLRGLDSLENGDYVRAEFLFGLTLREEPGQSLIWSKLAELMLLIEEYGRAEDYAFKSINNEATADNPLLHYRNWVIIHEARRRRGDAFGLDKARQELGRFELIEN